MKELTLSQILGEAFERARNLGAPLSVRLESFADSVRVASPAFAEEVDRLVARLNLNGSGATAPAVGDPMPPFMLPDDEGHLVTLEQLLAKGPVALSFHRGHWCPYCRLNTNALAQAQREVEPIGAQIVAITPDLQHFTTALKSDAAAKPFPILTDVDNGYALSLNLAIFVGLEMRSV
jgi:peroxiredoxin